MQWQQVLVIRNTTVEGPLFQTTLLNIFPIPETGLYNLANTWKRQMTPLGRVVTFSTNQWGCQRKRKIRTSKRRLNVSSSMHVVERMLQSEDLSSSTHSDTDEETFGIYFHICQTKEWDQFGCTVHFLASKCLTSKVKKYWLMNRHYSKEYIHIANR